MKDVMVNGVHQGVDLITDFGSNDTLDLSDFFKTERASLNDEVRITAGAGSSTLSIKMGDAWVDVAVLQGVMGGDADAWASDGMIMVGY
jgi:hypothetical protein